MFRFSYFIIFLLVNTWGYSQLLVHEPFDYADLNPLDWAAGGTGWTNEWTRGTGDDIIVRPDNLPYLNLTDEDGNYLAAHYEVVGLRYNRAIESIPDQGQTVWIAFVMRTDAENNPNGVANITLTKGGNQVLSIGQKFGNERFGLVWPNAPNYNSNVPVEGAHWVVTKLQYSGSNQSEEAFLWIDPNPQNGMPDEATADLAVPQSGQPGLNINFGFDGVQVKVEGGAPLRVDFDELRIGNTFADVNPFLASSVEVAAADRTIELYPNPTRRSFSIRGMDGQAVDLQLLNGAGMVVFSQDQVAAQQPVELPHHLPAGVYIVRLQKGNRVSAHRIVLR